MRRVLILMTAVVLLVLVAAVRFSVAGQSGSITGRIAAILDAAAPLAVDVHTIDAGSKTPIPGLIDSHWLAGFGAGSGSDRGARAGPTAWRFRVAVPAT